MGRPTCQCASSPAAAQGVAARAGAPCEGGRAERRPRHRALQGCESPAPPCAPLPPCHPHATATRAGGRLRCHGAHGQGVGIGYGDRVRGSPPARLPVRLGAHRLPARPAALLRAKRLCVRAARLMGMAVSLPELHRTCAPVGSVEGFDLRLCNRILMHGAPRLLSVPSSTRPDTDGHIGSDGIFCQGTRSASPKHSADVCATLCL